MARVNYQREKRLKDLDRQRKQEEKRTKRLLKDGTPDDGTLPQEGLEAPADPETGANGPAPAEPGD